MHTLNISIIINWNVKYNSITIRNSLNDFSTTPLIFPQLKHSCVKIIRARQLKFMSCWNWKELKVKILIYWITIYGCNKCVPHGDYLIFRNFKSCKLCQSRIKMGSVGYALNTYMSLAAGFLVNSKQYFDWYKCLILVHS